VLCSKVTFEKATVEVNCNCVLLNTFSIMLKMTIFEQWKKEFEANESNRYDRVFVYSQL